VAIASFEAVLEVSGLKAATGSVRV